MTNILTNNFRVALASKFKEDIFSNVISDSYYLFIGKIQEWVDENLPPMPIDSPYQLQEVWKDILALKKLAPSDASLVVPKSLWDSTGNTKYVQYDDRDANLFFHPTTSEQIAANLGGYTPGTFYVMTDEFHVFKCISNNNNSLSTDKPTKPLDNISIVETSDGYKWKYLFTVQTADAIKFLINATPETNSPFSGWMPVKTLNADDGSDQWIVQTNTSGGTLDNIILVNAGSGSSGVSPNQLPLVAATINTVTLDATSSVIDDFYNNSILWIESGLADGEYKKIIDYNGVTKIATLESNFSTTPTAGDLYRILPEVVVTGDGTGAVVKAFTETVAPFEISSFEIINAGTGYNFITLSIPGNTAEFYGVLPPVGGHGKDPIYELGASWVMLYFELQFDEGSGDFPVNNDYRQTGIIRNPLDFNSVNICSATTRIATKRLQVASTIGTFSGDELISGNLTGNAQLVEAIVDPNDGTKLLLSYIQNQNTGFQNFTIGDTITGSISLASATISDIIDPEVEPYSGKILIYENRRKITRNPLQTEKIKPIIKF